MPLLTHIRRKARIGSLPIVYRFLPAIAAAVVALSLGLWLASAPPATASLYTVVTDGEVYSPGDTVLISGSGYTPATSYDVVVVRPDAQIFTGDGSNTPGWDAVLADVDGNLSYSYLLPTDAPAGSYAVEVYATDDTAHTSLLASTDFYDDTPYPLTISQTTVGLTVTVSGTWKWDGCVSKSNANKHIGFAIDWGDGTGVPNPSPPPATSRDGVKPTSGTTWANCAPPGTGSWGSVSHTYAGSVSNVPVCVIGYHVSFHAPNPPATSGDGSTNPPS